MRRPNLWMKIITVSLLLVLIGTGCNFPTPVPPTTVSPTPTSTPAPLQPATAGISGPISSSQQTKLSTISVEILAVRVSDDDGSRQANIDPAEVFMWVQKANQIYQDAGIHFDFVADENGPDWMDIQDTALNNLSSNGTSWKEANAFAAKYPCKLTVFFRHGPGANPTGNGFAFPPSSGSSTNFVAMPGYFNTYVVVSEEADGSWHWVQNEWIFAHETGHFFGLYHTFPGWEDNHFYCSQDPKFCGGNFFNAVPPVGPDKVSKEATQIMLDYINANGSSTAAFDGDGLSDTPPDPGTQYYFTQHWDPCNGPDSFQIGPYSFSPDRHNMMSYFACDPQHFTFQQAQVIRQTAATRFSSCNSALANLPKVYYRPPLKFSPDPVLTSSNCLSDPDSTSASLLAFQPGQYVYADGRSGDSAWVHVEVNGLETRDFAPPTNSGNSPPAGAMQGCWVPSSVLDMSYGANLAALPAVQSDSTSGPFSGIRLSPNLVHFGAQSCGPRQVTVSVRAQQPNGIKVVVFFYRLQDLNTKQFTPWNEGLSMNPSGDGLYTLTLQGNTLAQLANSKFDQALVHYQFVIQPDQGDNINSQVFSDLTLASCGSGSRPGATPALIPGPMFVIPSATPGSGIMVP